MYKTSLLSCTATVAIILFNIQFTAHAENLEASEGKTVSKSDETYEIIHAKGGKITGTNLTVVGNKDVNSSENKNVYAVTSEGANSAIELLENTTIKGTDSFISLGVEAKGGATFQMTGGSITVSNTGAHFSNNNNKESKLKDVTISSDKKDESLHIGILADKNGIVTLEDVKVTQAINAIVANTNSTIKVSGGSFDAKEATIAAQNGGTVILTDYAQITSSNGYGLHAKDNGAISMTGGTIKTSYNGASFKNTKSNKNKLENVAISSNHEDGALLNYGIEAKNNSTVTLKDVTVTQAENAIVANTNSTITVSGGSFDAKLATIAAKNGGTVILTDGAQLTSSKNNGLYAFDNGAISMTGGRIKASFNGASFVNSNSDKNKLENVAISSSGKNGALLNYGIEAKNNGAITLKDVTVIQATNAIFADGFSTITVSGGSFDAKEATIFTQNGSTIILNDNAQITSSDDAGLLAKDPNSTITMTTGKVTGSNYGSSKAAIFAQNGGHIKVTNASLSMATGFGFGANATGSDSEIELHGTEINNTFLGLRAENSGIIKMTGGTITAFSGGATFYNSNSDENTLKDVTISSSQSDEKLMFTGLSSQASHVTLKNVTVTQAGNAVVADDSSKITISGGLFDAKAITILAKNGSTITLTDDAQITSANDYGLFANGLDSTITMTGGTVTAKEGAFAVKDGGHIDVTNVSATAENSSIKFEKPKQDTTSEVNLTNAKLHIENGIGINVDESTATVNLGKNSEIHADVLSVIKASTEGDNLVFTLNADNSVLEGRAKMINSPKTIFDLQNKTKWTLKISKNEKDAAGNLLDIAQRSRSDVSVLNLNNSSIVFSEPTEEHYQTLHIGSGKPGTQAVYKASGDAQIGFNIAWSDGEAIADQKTDRLLINGDVSGNTSVYIQSDSGDRNSVVNAADPSNTGGLSLIQVSGKAQEDSFKLVNGYTTRGRLPYKYTLTAYGPDSSHGQANIEQNLFDEKNENFWDFRLHKEILETGSGPTVNSLVPQTASYLVMPNALFYSGLTDMAKQNALLANMRTSVLGKEEDKQIGFFLYTYGSTGSLSSERGPFKYGYGADIRYAALQAGITLAAIEGQNATTRFGLVGTYGQLSFTPKDMADAGKSTVDKWSLTAYGSLQHNSGFYVDTLLSYGIIKGNITNALIGTTAKLNDAKMLSISTTVGKEFATGVEGLTFEPQAQLAYQHLMFNTIEDADNFTVDMKNPSQWLIRVGGRLTKTISTENNLPMSFYGKVNLIKTFGDNGTIYIGRDFDLDPMGPAIEGGIGINAQLSHHLSLHGDVSYQQKLQKTGISGASFSGGIRYQF